MPKHSLGQQHSAESVLSNLAFVVPALKQGRKAALVFGLAVVPAPAPLFEDVELVQAEVAVWVLVLERVPVGSLLFGVPP